MVSSPQVIAISGISGSGKSTLAQALAQRMDAVVLCVDDYYRETDPEALEATNFEDPALTDWELLLAHLDELKEGRPVEVPQYCYTRCRRIAFHRRNPRPTVIVEGQYALTQPQLVERTDLSVLIRIDLAEAEERRCHRDVSVHGRRAEDSRARFAREIAPTYREFSPRMEALSPLQLEPSEVAHWVQQVDLALRTPARANFLA